MNNPSPMANPNPIRLPSPNPTTARIRDDHERMDRARIQSRGEYQGVDQQIRFRENPCPDRESRQMRNVLQMRDGNRSRQCDR